jgi:hypothetical protein
MFYAFRVNSALAQLGIRHLLLTQTTRAAMQNAGKAAGHTPQEVAACLAAQLPLIHRVQLQVDVIEQWIVTGKINHKSDAMRAARGELALWDLTMPAG